MDPLQETSNPDQKSESSNLNKNEQPSQPSNSNSNNNSKAVEKNQDSNLESEFKPKLIQQEQSIPSNIPSDTSESSQSEHFQQDAIKNLNVISNLQNAVLPQTELLEDGTKVEYLYNSSGELCRIKRRGEDGIERDPSNTSSVEFKPTPIPQHYHNEEKENDENNDTKSQADSLSDFASVSSGVTEDFKIEPEPVFDQIGQDRDYDDDEDDGQIFDIRDYSVSGNFERLVKKFETILKDWKLKNTMDEDARTVEHQGKKFSVRFKSQEMTVNSDFPMRAHRLRRWFLVPRFFVCTCVEGYDYSGYISIEDANQTLAALSLAVRDQLGMELGSIPCFVGLEQNCSHTIGEWMGGAGVSDGTELYVDVLPWNERGLILKHYETDIAHHIDPRLNHMSGLLEMFYIKIGINKIHTEFKEPNDITAAVRFCYLADSFLPEPDIRDPDDFKKHKKHIEDEGIHDVDSSDVEEDDPVEMLQLSCIWPPFPHNAFTDTAVYSELDPFSAPEWSLRLVEKLKRENRPCKKSMQLRRLYKLWHNTPIDMSLPEQLSTFGTATDFKKRRNSIVQLDSSGEQIVLPSEDFINASVSRAFKGLGMSDDLRSPDIIKDAPESSCLPLLAERASLCKSPKGVFLLYSQFIAELRHCWNSGQFISNVLPKYKHLQKHMEETLKQRSNESEKLLNELINHKECLLQQKIGVILACVVLRFLDNERSLEQGSAEINQDKLNDLTNENDEMKEPHLPPILPMTTDQIALELNTIPDSKFNSIDAVLKRRNLCMDMAFFRKSNPNAELGSFRVWYTKTQPTASANSDLGVVYAAKCWEQSNNILSYEREAEMALHYLETLSCSDLMSQLFECLMGGMFVELGRQSRLSKGLNEQKENTQKAISKAYQERNIHISPSTSELKFTQLFKPTQQHADEIFKLFENWEISCKLYASLSVKMPSGSRSDSLLDPLLAGRESPVSDPEDRQIVEALFRPSDTSTGNSWPAPFCREFIFRFKNGAGGRMYAELRRSQIRLAVCNVVPVQ